MKRGWMLEKIQDQLEKLYPVTVTRDEMQAAYINLSSCGFFHQPDVDYLFKKLTGYSEAPEYDVKMQLSEKHGNRVKAMAGPHGKAICKALLIQHGYLK